MRLTAGIRAERWNGAQHQRGRGGVRDGEKYRPAPGRKGRFRLGCVWLMRVDQGVQEVWDGDVYEREADRRGGYGRSDRVPGSSIPRIFPDLAALGETRRMTVPGSRAQPAIPRSRAEGRR